MGMEGFKENVVTVAVGLGLAGAVLSQDQTARRADYSRAFGQSRLESCAPAILRESIGFRAEMGGKCLNTGIDLDVKDCIDGVNDRIDYCIEHDASNQIR